jgi:hypothetical protein
MNAMKVSGCCGNWIKLRGVMRDVTDYIDYYPRQVTISGDREEEGKTRCSFYYANRNTSMYKAHLIISAWGDIL